MTFTDPFFEEVSLTREKYWDCLETTKEFTFDPINGAATVRFLSDEFPDADSPPEANTAEITQEHRQLFQTITGKDLHNAIYDYVQEQLPTMEFDQVTNQFFRDRQKLLSLLELQAITAQKYDDEDCFVLSFLCDPWDGEHGIDVLVSRSQFYAGPGSVFF
jgi:hypothetical protein